MEFLDDLGCAMIVRYRAIMITSLVTGRAMTMELEGLEVTGCAVAVPPGRLPGELKAALDRAHDVAKAEKAPNTRRAYQSDLGAFHRRRDFHRLRGGDSRLHCRLAPHVLERLRTHCRVADGVRDAGVAQEVLQPPSVHAFGGQCVAGRMPDHVDVNREW
jgi:hypothetical protein